MKTFLFFLLMNGVISFTVNTAGASSAMEKKLVELRKEVQGLDLDIQIQKELKKEANIQAQSERLVLENELRKLDSELNSLKSQKTDNKALEQVTSLESYDKGRLLNQLASIKESLLSSTPLRLKDRVKVLDQLVQSLKSEDLKLDHLVQLLDFYEDENALSEGLVSLKEDLTIKGQTSNCRVVSAGMSILFYSCATGDSGVLKKEQNVWLGEKTHSKSVESFIKSQFEPGTKENFSIPFRI